MKTIGIALFPTTIGSCGIAWSESRIVGVQIGSEDADEARFHLLERFPDAVERDQPAFVSNAIIKIQDLLQGELVMFDDTPIDLDSSPELNQKVYEIIQQLKPGETTTYGAIARELGDVSLSQAVGYALGKNPIPIIVPCHRVLGANGKVGGFSASGGTETKLRILNIERARIRNVPDLFGGGLPLQQKPQQD